MENKRPFIPQEMQDLLLQRNNAIVAINRRTGGAQLTPVWYDWDGEAFYFRTAKNTAKYANLTRDPSISLLIEDQAGFRYITAYGEAQIIDPDPVEIAARIARKYYSPDQTDEIISQYPEPDVVAIQLRPEKIIAVIEGIAREASNSWSL